MIISVFSNVAFRGVSAWLIAGLLPMLAEPHSSSHKSLLFDATDSGALSNCVSRQSCLGSANDVVLWRASKRSLRHQLEQATTHYANILIATDDYHSPAAKSALVAAHAVLVPIAYDSPPFSLPQRLVESISTGRLFNPRLRIFLLPVCANAASDLLPARSTNAARWPGAVLLEPLATQLLQTDARHRTTSEETYFRRLRDQLFSEAHAPSPRHMQPVPDGRLGQQIARLRRIAFQFLA